MNNRAIDGFFKEHGLADQVEKQVHYPNEIWFLRAGGFPILIQTQESANRMRIVAFISDDAASLDSEELSRLLQANYHSALDARYALTDDGQLVAAFLYPFAELHRDQFILGLCQVINCAETCGTSYSGGTMVFGRRQPLGEAEDGDEPVLVTSLDELVQRLRGS